MVHVLERFQALMKSEYRKEDDAFIEREGWYKAALGIFKQSWAEDRISYQFFVSKG